MTSVRVAVAIALCISGLFFACPAMADAATAETLFREGKKLLDSGDYDMACAKLAESQAQEASSGTLLNLALCHEKQGKLATAWAEYVAAARLANAQGKRERAEVALKKGEELESRLPRITIQGEVVPGIKITRGQEELGPGALGTASPVDPGRYAVTASAPGYRSYATEIEVAEGESKSVVLPALKREATEEPKVTVTTPRAESPRDVPASSSTRTLGFIAGGVGAVGLAIGAGFGVSSLASYSDAEAKCPSRRDCSDDARTTRDRAETQAWIANVALGVGVLGLAAGAYVVLTSTPTKVSGTKIYVAPSGVHLGGVF